MEDEMIMRPQEAPKKNMKEFMKWYFHVDFKDITNYIAFLLAVFLFWWGISSILKALSI